MEGFLWRLCTEYVSTNWLWPLLGTQPFLVYTVCFNYCSFWRLSNSPIYHTYYFLLFNVFIFWLLFYFYNFENLFSFIFYTPLFYSWLIGQGGFGYWCYPNFNISVLCNTQYTSIHFFSYIFLFHGMLLTWLIQISCIWFIEPGQCHPGIYLNFLINDNIILVIDLV